MEINILSSRDIGEIVLRKRKDMKMSQMEAAGLLGVGVRFLSELERGKETLELGKVLQVLQGLGLSVSLKDIRRETL